jgi:alanine dehydrogenase
MMDFDFLGIGKQVMIIGVPKELKVAEKRVAITPAGVKMLRKEGHIVLIEAGAGLGSGFLDESYLEQELELRTDPRRYGPLQK